MPTIIAPNTRIFNSILATFLLSSVCIFKPLHGAESDHFCLKSIKDSLEDPFSYLLSWDFKNIKQGDICRFTGVECWNFNEDRVQSLRLSNMSLKGQFPRGVANCTSLQILDLSSNELSGSIPSDISNLLPQICSLDLSNNDFSGEIPRTIAKLSFLETLRLGGNHLTGEIPQELEILPRIHVLNVDNNFLSGRVPIFSNINVRVSYANNSGLCGGTLGTCDEGLFDRSFWYSFVIGYVASATSVIVSFMYFCVPWAELRKRRRRNAISSYARKKENPQKGTRQVAELLPLALQEERDKEFSRLLERLLHRMSFTELCKATDYFSTENIIGLGTTGIIYKAELPNNSFLAVKRLYISENYKKEFLLETMIPGRHKHQNIVPLISFSIERNERILVYKYMSNGRLDDYLHHEGAEPMILEWPIRVHIALGLARGLLWLHKKCKIVHLNLSSDCVLLDRNFEPKISNFRKAMFINQTIRDHLRMKLFVINGLGMKGSVEKDVYDFGVILFELITGKKLNFMNDSSNSDDGSLLKYIRNNSFKSASDFYDVIDKSVIGKGFDGKIIGLLEVACDCVKPSLEQRPKMNDIYKSIRTMWVGCGPWFDSEKLKLSNVCPVEITNNNEIECIY